MDSKIDADEALAHQLAFQLDEDDEDDAIAQALAESLNKPGQDFYDPSQDVPEYQPPGSDDEENDIGLTPVVSSSASQRLFRDEFQQQFPRESKSDIPSEFWTRAPQGRRTRKYEDPVPTGELRQKPRTWPRSLPRQMQAATQFENPIANPADGSPLLQIISRESLLCIVDVLYFPDAFAFAKTCKAIHALINLKLKKKQYINALISTETLSDYKENWLLPRVLLSDARGSRGFCDVCLYCLPLNYFPSKRMGGETSSSSDELLGSVCMDCVDFRKRVRAENQQLEESEGFEIIGEKTALAAPVWRPNRRVTVKDTGGFLWYRKRI